MAKKRKSSRTIPEAPKNSPYAIRIEKEAAEKEAALIKAMVEGLSPLFETLNENFPKSS